MTIEVSLAIPDTVYRQAQKLAKVRQQTVYTVLADELTKSIIGHNRNNGETAPVHDESVAREQSAYQAMHATLWQKYPDHHVAIHGGQLVDHDVDGIALSRRIYAKFPNEFVLIKTVEAQPDRILRFRSPRFAKATP